MSGKWETVWNIRKKCALNGNNLAHTYQTVRFSILIDHLNGVQEAKRFFLSIEWEQSAISVITRAEILVGVGTEDAPLVKALLDQFHLLIIDKSIADLAAELRKGQGWKLPDAFQAALCVYHNLKLSTRNSKDFNPDRHDFVEIPYELRRK